MMLVLRILAAWLLIDTILLALWCYAHRNEEHENDLEDQAAFLETWEARHA